MTLSLLLAALLLGPADVVVEPPVVPEAQSTDARIAVATSLLKSGQSRKEVRAEMVKAGASEKEAAALVDLAVEQCGCEVTQDGPRIAAVGGGWVVLGSGDTPTDYTGLLSLAVDWPLTSSREHPLVAHVDADYTGLSDPEIVLEDARDFNAIEFSLWASIRPLKAVSASLYCEVGYATRFAGDVAEPKTSAPLWSSFGLAFWDDGDSNARLRVGIGPDERLGFGWTMALQVKGSIRLPFPESMKGLGGTLILRSILGMETPVGQQQRFNQHNAGLGLSWGNR